MVSFMADVIGIRDDMYIGKGHAYQKTVVDAVTQGYKDGILEQKPTLVNLQCDVDHPTQSMSDIMHVIHQLVGGVENVDKLKGKKIAMTWAYSPSYGKPLSVPQGVIGLLFEGKATSVQNSAEYLRSFTKGFTSLPKMISNGDTPVVACYEQGCGAMFEVNLDKEVELSSILRVELENIDKSIEYINRQIEELKSSAIFAADSETITFAAAPIIVRFPPRQAPNDKLHHKGSRFILVPNSEISGVIVAV